MATHAPITGAQTRAPVFKLNGVTFAADEPYPFLDQAHGVLACLEEALRETENGPLNPLILQAAAQGAATLVHLAAIGLDVMDKGRQTTS